MLTRRQVPILVLVATLFWVGATAWIRFFPDGVTDPARGDLGFVVSLPVCWLCVHLGRRWAGLAREQLVAGTALVVAVAALIDASALRWASGIYGEGDLIARLGAAWLLWGYGLSLAIALLMARRRAEG